MKRFYEDVSVVPAQEGFAVELDGKAVRTPAGRLLSLPTERLALAVAQEWRVQGGDILVASMGLLRLSNTAIDGVMVRRPETIDALERFGKSDLLCYRADQPAALLARQCEGWDPWLKWAQRRHGAGLKVVLGLEPVRQPPQALGALRQALEEFDAFSLAGLEVVVSLTGSLVLGLAVAEGVLDAGKAFGLSRIDEVYQSEQWGKDSQAAMLVLARERELEKAVELIGLVRPWIR